MPLKRGEMMAGVLDAIGSLATVVVVVVVAAAVAAVEIEDSSHCIADWTYNPCSESFGR